MRGLLVAGMMVVAGAAATAAETPKAILDDAFAPRGDFGISARTFIAGVANDASLSLREGECGENGGRQYCSAVATAAATKIFAYMDQTGRVTQVAISLAAAEWAVGGSVVDSVQRHLLVPPEYRIRGASLTKAAQTIPGVPFPEGSKAIACFGLVPPGKANEAQVVCSAR